MRKWARRSIAFCGIGSAVVAEITIYLLGLFLAHEWLENLLAIFCFLGEIAHFLKFCSTAHSAKPNHLRLLLLFGGKVLSVVLQKAIRGIFWEFRHLYGGFDYREAMGKTTLKKDSPVQSSESLNRGTRIVVRTAIISRNDRKINDFLLFLIRGRSHQNHSAFLFGNPLV